MLRKIKDLFTGKTVEVEVIKQNDFFSVVKIVKTGEKRIVPTSDLRER